MKALNKTFVLLLAAFGLASCGGGGGGSQSAFSPTPVDTITISPASTSVVTNSFTTLTVTVKKQDGTVEANGTAINASVTPSTIGTVSGASGTAAGATATNTLSGGSTTFNFTSSNQPGTATITISIPAGTNGTATTATKSVDITVTSGNVQDPRLQLSTDSPTLPVRPPSVPTSADFVGSPYVAEVTLTWRHSNGQLVNGTSQVNVSVAPTAVIGFSTLNKSGTSDEFHTILGSGPVDVTGGVGTIYIHAGTTPGTGILTVTAIDPDNSQTISSQMEFIVAGATGNLPASVSAVASSPAYISGGPGGPQSAVVEALVLDGNNVLAADPAAGVDNVQFQIVGPAGSDATLVGLNAAGQQVSGATINTVSHNGVASVTLRPGSQQGPVQVKATADRADNNVDNGIQDGVSATATVVVSDGKLFSIKITNPAVSPNLLPVVVDATLAGINTSSPVFTLPVTVLATDRQGNPVLAGTQIQFGLIDAPVFGYPDQGSGTFELSGNDGNPQEGGTLFGAPGGAFLTAGAGAGPGDALVLFGKDTTGDADLEGARTVQRIDTQTILHVTNAFNLNDTTGTSVDTGNNIPYVIGRATAGNIDASAFTGADASGVPNGSAQVTMRYPQSRIGQSAVVWAQGTGANQSNGAAKTVADAVRTRYLGLGPATLSASPTTIFGNTPQTVTVCLNDAAGSPIPGITITFQFANLGTATGTADGKASGTLTHPTGADGCTVTTVVTSGVLPGATSQIIFSVGDLTATVDITVGSAVLTAVPSHVVSSANAVVTVQRAVTLTLKDGLGNLVPNAIITGQCTSTGGTISLDASQYITGDGTSGTKLGMVVATISTLNFCVESGTAPSGLCTFTYSQGSVTAQAFVTVSGVNTNGTSPGCGP